MLSLLEGEAGKRSKSGGTRAQKLSMTGNY